MSREAKARIAELKHQYCYTIDGGDYEAWANLFTPDGRFVRDNGDAYEGREEIRRFATEEFDAAFADSAHIVTNPLIDVDGEEATGKWYLFLLTETKGGEVNWRQARYDDEYRRVDGEWHVSEINITYGVAPDGG